MQSAGNRSQWFVALHSHDGTYRGLRKTICAMLLLTAVADLCIGMLSSQNRSAWMASHLRSKLEGKP